MATNLLARVGRLERVTPPVDLSPEAQMWRLQALIEKDGVAGEMVTRMRRRLINDYRFASEDERKRARHADPLLAALRERFFERLRELEAGAAPTGDYFDRLRRMDLHLPPLGWAGPWPFEDAA